MTSWVPDYSIEAPEGHTWMRPVDNCPDCKCCSAQLCDRARRALLDCKQCSDGPADFDLSRCPCIGDSTAAIRAARLAVQAVPDDDAAIEAGAQALHAVMTRPMSSPPAWDSSPYNTDYWALVRKGLSRLREPSEYD